MDTEDKIIISFLYKRSGKEEMTFTELYLTLSMELNWFTPDDAKKFLNIAIKNKILLQNKEKLKPNFDIEKTKIPTGFFPSDKVFEVEQIKQSKKKEKELLSELFEEIIEKSNLDKSIIKKDVEKIANEKNITLEVAALLKAKEYKLDLNQFYQKVQEKIFT